MGNGNLLEDIKRTQKISAHIWGKEEKHRKNIHICIWTTLQGLPEKLFGNNQAQLFPIRKFKFERKLKQGDRHKAVSLSKKDVRSKGRTGKANLFVYKPFYLKPILLETPRSTQIKYPLRWLVFLALEVLCVAFEINFTFFFPSATLGPLERWSFPPAEAAPGVRGFLCRG